MSRLDSFLRRLQAQRDCLNAAVSLVADRPGPIFELGLGNGRTYDHLRSLLDRKLRHFRRLCLKPCRVVDLHLHVDPAFQIGHGHTRRLLCGARQFLHPFIRRCERQEHCDLHCFVTIKPESTPR